MVKKGAIYRHFKGGMYKVLCIGYHSETQEKMVVYRDIETDKVCIRPYDMFISDVDHEKYPDVKQKKRFELITFNKKRNKRKRLLSNIKNDKVIMESYFDDIPCCDAEDNTKECEFTNEEKIKMAEDHAAFMDKVEKENLAYSDFENDTEKCKNYLQDLKN